MTYNKSNQKPTRHEFLTETSAKTIEQLISIGVDLHCTHLWVLPSCGLEFTEVEANVDGEGKHNEAAYWYSISSKKDTLRLDGTRAKENMVVSVTGYRRIPRSLAKIHIIFFKQSKWSLLPADPDRLADMVEEVEGTLGVQLSGAPATVGVRYLKLKNDRHGEEYFKKPSHFIDQATQQEIPIRWEIFKKLGEKNNAISWFPVPCADQLAMKYIHCFDRNSSHPYAAAHSKFGIGNPVRVGACEFNHLLPGYWNVEIEGIEDLCADLPPLLPGKDKNGIYVSVPTPLVKMAQGRGCQINVERAMVWGGKEHRAPVFERWGNELWLLRQRYENDSLERQAVKLIMNSTVGFTRHGDAYDDDFRSDWYDQIVAEERAVVWYRAWKIAKDHGIYPIGCYHDALFYISDSPDPASVPGILKPGVFGGYKCEWTLQMTPAAQKALISKLSPNYKIGELKKLLKRGNA